MSSTTPATAQDISNCLNAPFDPTNGTSPGSWSLCYNQHQNNLSLSIHLAQPGGMMESAPLVSTIDSDGLKGMIEFLYQVNMQMQQQSKKSL